MQSIFSVITMNDVEYVFLIDIYYKYSIYSLACNVYLGVEASFYTRERATKRAREMCGAFVCMILIGCNCVFFCVCTGVVLCDCGSDRV